MIEVTTRPIIFKGDMIRAILDGRKTETRKIIKAQPFFCNGAWQIKYKTYTEENWCYEESEMLEYMQSICPFGQVGDRLWVRETFCPYPEENTGRIYYRASHENQRDRAKSATKLSKHLYDWRPSIFMPRWVSRITLEITEISVERLQNMDRAAAFLEGCPEEVGGHDGDIAAAHQWFKDLWNTINTKRGYSWDSNPWVWVVRFKRITDVQ